MNSAAHHGCGAAHSGPPRRSGPEIRCSGWLAIVRAFTLAFVRLGEDLLPGQSKAATAHRPTEQCARGASLTALPHAQCACGRRLHWLGCPCAHYRCGLFALSVPLPPSQNTLTLVPALPAGRARVQAAPDRRRACRQGQGPTHTELLCHEWRLRCLARAYHAPTTRHVVIAVRGVSSLPNGGEGCARPALADGLSLG